MPDLSTVYLGLDLRNPVVASASPLTGDLGSLLALEEAGVGAVVLPSLFEEQIERDELAVHAALELGAHSFGEALTYLPELEDLGSGPDAHLELVAEAKRRLEIPVIASLNGTSVGGWVRYARLMQDAGADAIELNAYAVEADPAVEGAQVERSLFALVGEVRRAVSVPLAVKLSPYYSSLANVARRVVEAGADGLVCFNRFLGPDIDLETLTVEPHLTLSSQDQLRLRLRWVAILRGRVAADLAATGGVNDADDVVKLVLAGADVVMVASALLRHGPERASNLVGGLADWLEEHEYASVDQARGSLSQVSSRDPAAFERAQYLRAVTTYRVTRPAG
jgi:dihydroorotate dehydrogenase (fumarate)